MFQIFQVFIRRDCKKTNLTKSYKEREVVESIDRFHPEGTRNIKVMYHAF